MLSLTLLMINSLHDDIDLLRQAIDNFNEACEEFYQEIANSEIVLIEQQHQDIGKTILISQTNSGALNGPKPDNCHRNGPEGCHRSEPGDCHRNEPDSHQRNEPEGCHRNEQGTANFLPSVITPPQPSLTGGSMWRNQPPPQRTFEIVWSKPISSNILEAFFLATGPVNNPKTMSTLYSITQEPNWKKRKRRLKTNIPYH